MPPGNYYPNHIQIQNQDEHCLDFVSVTEKQNHDPKRLLEERPHFSLKLSTLRESQSRNFREEAGSRNRNRNHRVQLLGFHLNNSFSLFSYALWKTPSQEGSTQSKLVPGTSLIIHPENATTDLLQANLLKEFLKLLIPPSQISLVCIKLRKKKQKLKAIALWHCKAVLCTCGNKNIRVIAEKRGISVQLWQKGVAVTIIQGVYKDVFICTSCEYNLKSVYHVGWCLSL